jgi:transposase
LPEAEKVCPSCGKPLQACGSEDSEQLESESIVFRRLSRRRRGPRTWACPGPRTCAAPPAAQLIPQSLLGVSVWVEILLDKFASYRPTQRLLEHGRSLGLDLTPGTITDGLQRLEPLFTPILAALLERNRPSPYKPADETRWLVFGEQQGQVGFGWWLWAFSSQDSVVYMRDASRSHRVPEEHYPAEAGGVLLVDRYSAWRQRWFPSGGHFSCGRSIPGGGCRGICTAARKRAATRRRTSTSSYRGTCRKRGAHSCAR